MTSLNRLSYITGWMVFHCAAVMAVLFYITNWGYILREVPDCEAFRSHLFPGTGGRRRCPFCCAGQKMIAATLLL